MKTRRRLVLRATTVLVALAASVGVASGARATTPPTTPAPAPEDPAPPPAASGDPQGEITESWALTPAGSDDPNGGNRGELSYVSDPGAVITDAVTVFNYGTVSETFRVYATDGYNEDDGQFGLLRGDEPPKDVGSWVAFPQEMLTVPPGKKATLPMTITIPMDAAVGDHAGAVLASSPTQGNDQDGNIVNLDRRTGTRLYVRINGPLSAELAAVDVHTTYDESINPLAGVAHVRFRMENRGNVRLSGTASVTVEGPLGIGSEKVELPDVPELLPGEHVDLATDVDGVAELGLGVTTVRVEPAPVTDVEAVGPVEATDRTFVVPIKLLLILLLVVIGLLGWRIVRRRRTSAAAAVDGLRADVDHDLEHQRT